MNNKCVRPPDYYYDIVRRNNLDENFHEMMGGKITCAPGDKHRLTDPQTLPYRTYYIKTSSKIYDYKTRSIANYEHQETSRRSSSKSRLTMSNSKAHSNTIKTHQNYKASSTIKHRQLENAVAKSDQLTANNSNISHIQETLILNLWFIIAIGFKINLL